MGEERKSGGVCRLAACAHYLPITPFLDRGFLVADQVDMVYMARALRLALKGRGRTSPNPMVGAVIVKDGRVVGEGWHRRAGSDHAEVAALKKAGAEAAGATVYVTLEPCCHTGNTGPCTDALIAAGVSRVVYASIDPDPRVRGRGDRRLRRAGIAVTAGVLKQETQQLNEAFFGYHRNGRPFITLKLAQSLDGRIATHTGDSKWISSPQARRAGHKLRAEADAVVVGMGTVRRDNPSLTVRMARGSNPFRVIVTSSADFPRSCRLLSDNSDLKTVVATTEKRVARLGRQLRRHNLIYWQVKAGRDRRLDLHDFVRKADAFGLRSLLVEGGAELATSFLKAGLVDKLVLFVAPKLLGSGVEAIGDLGISKVDKGLVLEPATVATAGPDLMISCYPKWRK